MTINSKTKLFLAIGFVVTVTITLVLGIAYGKNNEPISDNNSLNFSQKIAGTQIEKNLLSTKDVIRSTETKENITVYMALENGENFVLEGIEGSSLYELMKENSALTFEGKEFPALGFMVDSIGINKMESKNGEYLFYYINGVEAQVGVSHYKPKTGDRVEWKLK